MFCLLLYETLQNIIFSEFQLQIGFHTDPLFHIKNEKLKRDPKITIGFSVKAETMRIASPWGGNIYVKVLISPDFKVRKLA